jgi:hypothetical protein
LLTPRNRPGRRTADARDRRSDPFVKRGEPHPEAHASRSRPIRVRIAANSWRGTATAASWKTALHQNLQDASAAVPAYARSAAAVLTAGRLLAWLLAAAVGLHGAALLADGRRARRPGAPAGAGRSRESV